MRLGQEQIIAKIEELQAQLVQSIPDNNGVTPFIIQRYLDSLTSYTDTVCHEDIEWSDNDNLVSALVDLSPARAPSSPIDEVKCESHHSNDAEVYEDAKQFLHQELLLDAAVPEPLPTDIPTLPDPRQFPPLAHRGINGLPIRPHNERNLVTGIVIQIGLMTFLILPIFLLPNRTSSWNVGTYLYVIGSCFILSLLLFPIVMTGWDVGMLFVFGYGAVMTTFLASAQ